MHAIIEKNGGIQPHFDVDPTKSSTTAVVTTAPTTESTTKDEKDHSRDKFIQKSKYAAAMMEMMDTDDFDKYEEKEPTQYQSTIKDTTGIIDQENLTVSDNLICCYSDPLDPKNRIGRPFIMTDYIKTHWNQGGEQCVFLAYTALALTLTLVYTDTTLKNGQCAKK